VLAYLDALVAAITASNPAEIARLLAHPLARTLTRDARVEAEHVADNVALGGAVAAPLRLLQLRHQTAHLLGEHADDAERDVETAASWPSATRPVPRAPARHQMELPLSA
jgi:hypothetical protein